MTVKYKKIKRKTWDYKRDIPQCPSQGAFEIAYLDRTYFVLDGKRHKIDGPAEIRTNGTQKYYLWGKLHREDGPAVIWPNGTQNYYLFGKRYPKEIWGPLALQLNLKEQIL